MTGMTPWERHEAGLPPRDRGERQRFAEYDAAQGVTMIGYRSTRDEPLQVLRSPGLQPAGRAS